MKLGINFCVVALGIVVAVGSADASGKRRNSGSSQPMKRASMASGQRMAGCGLGSMVVEDDSKWSQVGASLLNGTGMQSFAISFGTSNCTEDGAVNASREKEAFTEANLADLRKDVAVGSGEYLAALASLYNCQGENSQVFMSKLSESRESIFQDVATVPASLKIADQAAAQCQI